VLHKKLAKSVTDLPAGKPRHGISGSITQSDEIVSAHCGQAIGLTVLGLPPVLDTQIPD
jgi:hypothetical protein